MASVKIVGGAVAITSTLKLEDIQKVQKFHPEQLVLMGGKNGDEPVFKIAVSHGAGDIGKYGISVSDEANSNGYAVATLGVYGVGNPKEYLINEYGGALTNLNKLEEQVSASLNAINAELATIGSQITVVE